MITAQRGQQQVTRNSSFFKPSPSAPMVQVAPAEVDAEPEPPPTPSPRSTVATPATPAPVFNRPRRDVKAPKRFEDFHMY